MLKVFDEMKIECLYLLLDLVNVTRIPVRIPVTISTAKIRKTMATHRIRRRFLFL